MVDVVGSVLGYTGPVAASGLPRRFRRLRRQVANIPGVGLTLALPRTVSFLVGSERRARTEPLAVRPRARVSVAMAAQVALDEAILGVMAGPGRLPNRAEFTRVGSEVLAAETLWRQRGWLTDPSAYHERPPALVDPATRTGHSRGLRYERLSFPSGYAPHPGEPGADRWQAYTPNAIAYADVLRHPGPPRPWLVCLHGLGMGSPLSDFAAFRAARLHRTAGLNVVFPVLPMHGPRRVGRLGGDEFAGFDQLNFVHGLAQAVWDVRRIISWVRAQDAPIIGLHGISLGGYVAALLAGIEPGLDAVIAGIPVVDFVRLMSHHAPASARRRGIEYHCLGERPTAVHRVVSPLAHPPRVPHDRRFIYAGLGDRMATPGQATILWEHWERPAIAWYPGNHVGFMWSSKVDRFVSDALVTSGLAERGVTLSA